MRGVSQFGKPKRCEGPVLRRARIVTFAALAVLFVLPAAAQYPGPPTRTTVNGHFLGTPPSVLSVSGQHLPPPLPSVTSIPNYGYTQWYQSAPYYNGYHRGRGYRNG